MDRSGTAVRSGLEAALREAVRSGRLHPGLRLPSSRVLARDLTVARNTVADVYAQLVAEGWLTSRHGSGTWVSQRPDLPEAAGAAEPARAGPPSVRYDLSAGIPDLSSFPRTAWLAACRRALSTAPSELFGYGDPRGLPQLRTAVADYLARARGVAAHPSQIVVCSGFSHGLELICRVLHGDGDDDGAIAVEGHGHPEHRQIIAGAGLRPVSLPVDASGAAVAGLVGNEDLADTRAVLLTPAHQFPTGVVLHPRRRHQAVLWARDAGGVLIEDDYDGEYRYDRHPVGALQALAPQQVIYAGTVSKSLVPGLRLGWLVVPEHLLDAVVETKRASGLLSSAIDQLTLAELIGSGGYDHQIRRNRLRYRRRRDTLLAALARRVPAVHVSGIAAGLHVLLQLTPDRPEGQVIAQAARRGLRIRGLSSYAADGQEAPPALVIGYATPPDHTYTAALTRLIAALGTG